MTQNRIQKISFEIFSTTISSIFVIWKNDKSKIIINLKKINIRFYSNVYFFFQTKYYFKNFKRIDNFLVYRFNEEFFSIKNEIDRLMKNHVRNFTSKTKTIYCVNNEIDQYFKKISISNEKFIVVVFLTIRIDLYKRYYYLFFSLN